MTTVIKHGLRLHRICLRPRLSFMPTAATATGQVGDMNSFTPHPDFGLAVFFDPKQLPRTDLGLEGTPWWVVPVCAGVPGGRC